MHVVGKQLCHLFSPFPARTHLRSTSSFNLLNESPRRRHFDRLLVLDFEATCDRKRGTIRPQEIIEFPVLNVETNSFEIVGTFHRYVKPEIHPTLTPFCTSLTGIIQDMVEDESPLKTVMEDFHQWFISQNLQNKKFAFVTCGDWDLQQLLPRQCIHTGLGIPAYFKSWINIKMIFAESTGVYPRNLPHMLSHANLVQSGRLHSGIDDCHNIAAVVRFLGLQQNSQWRLTSFLED
ncbi:ERI1 exoribonuclease 3-like [Daphnia carinata]|uniref:ERI1 exoribonuclease 3-like n=1 Tax=Daphnia carinata TaxID=120202 RepID=UPI0025805104|nr:ERI1 exoribonuclease 3-like [Daphnia carinata]XP_057369622.1 ERI1 exoribonuclease 3-like [Daphnia carinata]